MTGTKHDNGKPDLTLIPRTAAEAEARAFMFGEVKYGRDNYKAGFKVTRLAAAALRHVFAFMDGEDNDPESGISHLGHARASLGMLMECIKLETAIDDRFKKQEGESQDGNHHKTKKED